MLNKNAKTKHYKYFIERENDGFIFALFPNNSNSQPIAKSNVFTSKEIAIKKRLEFIEFMNANEKDIKSKIIYDEQENKKFKYVIKTNDIVFTQKSCPRIKSLCKKAVQCVIRNYNAELKSK